MRLIAEGSQDNITNGIGKLSNSLSNESQKSALSVKRMTQGGANKMVPADQRLETLEKHFDEKTLKRMGVIECTTCSNRTYQDESDDSGVSFQAPTKLRPNQAALAVRGHEQEHVVREQANARNEGKEVVKQSVQIFHSVCPECGSNYVSGGLTRTTTATKSKDNGYQDIPEEKTIGNLVDYSL